MLTVVGDTYLFSQMIYSIIYKCNGRHHILTMHRHSPMPSMPFSLFLCLSTLLVSLPSVYKQSTGVLVVIRTTHPWFTLLLPQSDSLLYLPHSNAIHPLSRKLQLLACKVSRSFSSRERFRAKLPTFSYNHGQMGPQNNMPHIPSTLHDFCSKWKIDSCNPSKKKVLDFLISLHERGLSYTTITQPTVLYLLSLSLLTG